MYGSWHGDVTPNNVSLCGSRHGAVIPYRRQVCVPIIKLNVPIIKLNVKNVNK